MVSNKF